jgi:hypothetical protein
LLGYVYNALLVDGAFGLWTVAGVSTFAQMSVRTDDPAFRADDGESVLVTDGSGARSGVESTLSAAALTPIVDEAIRRLVMGLGLDDDTHAALIRVDFNVADLPELALGTTTGNRVTLDVDGDGYGWFVDATPGDDAEFKRQTDDGLLATPDSDAYDGIDLLSVVMHEMGHVIGLDHDSGQFMQPVLNIGKRFSVDASSDGTSALVASVFDESREDFVEVEEARLLDLLSTDPDDVDDDDDWLVRGFNDGTGAAQGSGSPTASTGAGHEIGTNDEEEDLDDDDLLAEEEAASGALLGSLRIDWDGGFKGFGSTRSDRNAN